jgi:hypothetical protein
MTKIDTCKQYVLAIAAEGINHKEFERQAEMYADYQRSQGLEAFVETFDTKLGKKLRREVVEGIIRRYLSKPSECAEVAIFCHGGKKWLQTGHNSGRFGGYKVKDLANALTSNPDMPDPDVVLYACWCGKHFAKHLAMHLNFGCVAAHASKGHTTLNPQVVWFEPRTALGKQCVSVTSLCEGDPKTVKDMGEKFKRREVRYDLMRAYYDRWND